MAAPAPAGPDIAPYDDRITLATACAAAQRACAEAGSLEALLRRRRPRLVHLNSNSHTSVLMRLLHLHSSFPDNAVAKEVAIVLTALPAVVVLLWTHPTLFGLVHPLPCSHNKFEGNLFDTFALIGVTSSMTASLMMSLLAIGAFGSARLERLLLAVGIYMITLLQHGTVLVRGELYYLGAFGKPISVRGYVLT